MANMSYCRFENTLADLEDCYESLDADVELQSEIDAREELIKLCRTITKEYGDEYPDE